MKRVPVMTLILVMTVVMTLSCAPPLAPVVVMTPTVMTPTESVMTGVAAPELETFTVTASVLNIRDENQDATGEYFLFGAIVECIPSDDHWCKLSDNLQVWSGCLSPNPERLGCKEK